MARTQVFVFWQTGKPCAIRAGFSLINVRFVDCLCQYATDVLDAWRGRGETSSGVSVGYSYNVIYVSVHVLLGVCMFYFGLYFHLFTPLVI